MTKPRMLDPKFPLSSLVSYARSQGVSDAVAAGVWTILVYQELGQYMAIDEVQEVEIHLSVLRVAAAKPKSAYRNYGDVKRELLRGWVKTLS